MQYKNPGPPLPATSPVVLFCVSHQRGKGVTYLSPNPPNLSASGSGITGGPSLPFKVPSLHPSRTPIPRACIDDRVDVVWWVLWDAGQDYDVAAVESRSEVQAAVKM